MKYLILILSSLLGSDLYSQTNSLRNAAIGNQSNRMPASKVLQPSIQYPGLYNCEFNEMSHTDCTPEGIPQSYLNNQNTRQYLGSDTNQSVGGGNVNTIPSNSDDEAKRIQFIDNCANSNRGLTAVQCEEIFLQNGNQVDNSENKDNTIGASGRTNLISNKCEPGEIPNSRTGICEASSDTPSPTPNPTQRNQAFTETPDLCAQAKANAEGSCNSESQNWMRTINQVSTLLGTQMNAGACSALAATQVASAASLSLFTVQCGRAIDQCLTECRKNITSTDQQTKDDATEAVKVCNSKGVNAKKTEQEASGGIQQIAQAVQSCRATFGTTADNTGQAPGYVGKPDGDILAGLQQRNDQGLNHEGTGSGLTGDMNANVDLSDLVDDSPAAVAAKPRGMGQDPGGQQGSAGLGSSGGVGVDANSGRAANRKGSSGLLSNILSGFFGSGGGGLFGGGRAAGSGDRGAGGDGYGAGTQTGAKTPDLRQFLPGGKFDPKKQRNIAGRIVSKDGLIGPHGNLWRDVSNRYQVKRASLLP